MATYRTIINTVLKTLSEDQIATSVSELTDTYNILIGEFVNQIKEEIEDAHNWRVLRTAYSVTVLSGAYRATITGSNERSRLVREHDEASGRLRPLVFDVTDADEVELYEVDLDKMDRLIALEDSTFSEPYYFAIDTTTDGTPELVVYPQPTSNRTISVTMITPQARLATTDLDVNITIPQRPLESGSIWYALEERGEELGVNGIFTEERFRKALDDAISRDAAEQGGYELVPT